MDPRVKSFLEVRKDHYPIYVLMNGRSKLASCLSWLGIPLFTLFESGGGNVKWVKINYKSLTFEECPPSLFPKWLRLIFAIILVVPATLMGVILESFDKSQDRFLKNLLYMREIEEDFYQQFKIERKFYSEQELYNTLKKPLPQELIQKIFSLTIGDDPRQRALLSLVNKQFLYFSQTKSTWNGITLPLGINEEMFEEKPFKFFRQYKEIKASITDILNLFEHQNQFYELPLVQINTGCYFLNSPSGEKVEFQLFRHFFFQNRQVLSPYPAARLLTSCGLYALYFQCDLYINQSLRPNPHYFLFFHYQGKWNTFVIPHSYGGARYEKVVDAFDHNEQTLFLKNFIQGERSILATTFTSTYELQRRFPVVT